MSENLRDEIEKAVRGVTDLWDEPLDEVHDVPPIVSAVMEVVGPEMDRLRAEVERLTEQVETNNGIASNAMGILRAERDEAREECGHEKAMRAGLRHELGVWIDAKQKAEAERDDLRARLAKVEALADGWGARPTESGAWRFVRDLRAALAPVPEPSDSEPAPDADREAGGR